MEIYDAYGRRISSATDPGGLTLTQKARRAIDDVHKEKDLDHDVAKANLLSLVDYALGLVNKMGER